MGQLVSCSNKPPLHIHEAGFLYNIKLNNSSIKELKTLKRIIRTNIQDQNQFNIDDSILTKEIKNRETVLATTREKLFLQQQESTPRYCVTIIASFLLHSALLTFSFVIVQYTSYIWYCASYVPYGRTALLGCLKKCWSCLT